MWFDSVPTLITKWCV